MCLLNTHVFEKGSKRLASFKVTCLERHNCTFRHNFLRDYN